MGYGTNLASFAAAVNWREMPQEVRVKVVDHVLDTIGTMFAGIEVEVCGATRKAVDTWGRGDDATVVGIDGMYPAPSAAFLNALHGRIHTYDDTYEPGTLHPGSSVVAAAMALAEKHGVNGKAFLSAAAAGYEVATRIASAVSPSHYAAGFHNTGTCNVFGGATAAAHILGLDGTEMAEVFGLAGATAAGLRQHQIDGSMFDSALHGARAAQSGVMVAQLRAEGVKGPRDILDGPMGFCAVMAPERNFSRLDAQLGVKYEFMETTIKPYPTCRFVHGPIEAAMELQRRHKIDPLQISQIEIATFKLSVEVSDRAEVRGLSDASLSHQYGVALALTKNKVGLSSFSEAALSDLAVLELMKRIRVVNDPALEKQFPRMWPHRLTITLVDGRTVSTLSEYPPGRTSPISQDTVDNKFLENCSPYLGSNGAHQALSMIRNLHGSSDIRELTRILRPGRIGKRI